MILFNCFLHSTDSFQIFLRKKSTLFTKIKLFWTFSEVNNWLVLLRIDIFEFEILIESILNFSRRLFSSPIIIYYQLWWGPYSITVSSCRVLFQSSLLLYCWLSLIADIVVGCSICCRVAWLEYIWMCVSEQSTWAYHRANLVGLCSLSSRWLGMLLLCCLEAYPNAPIFQRYEVTYLWKQFSTQKNPDE